MKLGMEPLEAIRPATATGPLTLGPQAPRSGVLGEGFHADVITVDGNPLEDISILSDPANIKGVWKSGERIKG